MDGLDPFDAAGGWFSPKPAEPDASPSEPMSSHDGAAELVRLDGPAAEPAPVEPDAMPAEAQPVPMTILDHALGMAARGFRVFPILPGDKVPPKDLRWKDEATTDPAKIRSWFVTWPDANYGVAAGEGTLILDVDAGKNGYASLLDVDLPPTLTVKTPGGGEHQYFSGPDVANSVDRIAPGLDIRSAGGYVIGPGSFFADLGGKKGYTGPYHITNDIPPAAAPESLVLLAGAPPERGTRKPPMCEPDLPENVDWAVRAYLAREPENGGAPIAIEGKGGNQTTYQVFARLRELGISAEKSVELAEEHWNGRCLPPWSRSELVALAANADAYGQNTFGECAPTVAAEGFGEAVPIEPPSAAGKFDRIFAAGVEAEEDWTPEQWIGQGVLMRGEAAVLAGAGGTGKSGLTALLAVHGALGSSFAGCAVPAPFKTVLYNLEDSRKRVSAILRRTAEWNGADWSAVRARVLPWDGRELAFRLVNRDHTLAMADIRELAKVLRRERVDVLVLDPLVSLHHEEENDNSAMGTVMEALNGLARLANVAVLAVHHTSQSGKAGDVAAVRGATAIPNGVRLVSAAVKASRELVCETDKGGGLRVKPEMRDANGWAPPLDDLHRYVIWWPGVKANMSPDGSRPRYFEKGSGEVPALPGMTDSVLKMRHVTASAAAVREKVAVDPAREFHALGDADYAAFAASFTDDDILNAMGALGSHWRREQLPAPGARGPALDPADLAHTMVAAGCGWPLEAEESQRRASAMLRHLVETGRAELREMNAISHDGRKRLGVARSIRIVPAQERDKAVTSAMRVRELVKRGSQTQDGTWLFDDGRSPRSIALPFAIGFGIVSGDKFTRNGNAGTLTESEARQARFHVDTWIAEGRIVLSEEERAGVHYTIAQLSDGETKL